MQSTPKTIPSVKIQRREDRLALPGFGLPLDYTPVALNDYGVKTRSLFPTVLDERDIEAGYIDQPAVTLREKKMLRLINEFTDEPDWIDKVFDESYMKTWVMEVEEDLDITQKMVEWLVTELKFKAKTASKLGFVNIFNGDVVKSCADFFYPESFRKELCDTIKSLERGLRPAPEYQLATEKRKTDYVHPSFFPVVFGKTRILRDRTIGLDDAIEMMGEGEVLPVPRDSGPSRYELSWNIASRADIMVHPYSSRFQWLPSDVYFRPDGSCYFATYINNIHPKRDRQLYRELEKLLDKVIPMFDMTLTPVKSVLHSRARIALQEVKYEEKKPVTEPKPVESPQEERGSYEERLRAWRRKYFKAVHPEPGEFAPVEIPPEIMDELPLMEKIKQKQADIMDLKKEYGHRGLQVIVKIADMSLAPEEPDFYVQWHMEGQINEHICASSFYIFEAHNMEPARLSFRQVSDTKPFQDLRYERGDTVWLEEIFGMSQHNSPVQEVGGIECAQGRNMTWPNTLQHDCYLSLKDKTKPGHIRGVNFMLVDPNIRIISTANVPPQRSDWRPDADMAGVDMTKLSLEEKLKVLPRHGDFPWTLQEAREVWLQHRDERLKFNHYQNVAFHSKTVIL